MDAFRATLEEQPLWLMGLGLFAIFWLAAALGRRLRRLSPPHQEDGSGVVVSASLGLLALLLGFTVSMAVSRFEDRRVATTHEANAISTFIYRTDLLPADARAATLAELDRYVAARLTVARAGETLDTVAEAKRVTTEAAERMWQVVMRGRTDARDDTVELLVLESANAMFDAATARDAAVSNRLPSTLALLLLFFPIASLVLVGYVSNQTRGVHILASTEMILLLTLVLLLIADLDRPRSGTIFNSQQTLLDVQAQLKRASARLPAP